jgi:predicted secreted protein
MAYYVRGSGVVVEANKGGTYRRWACAQSVIITVETELLETSTPTTGAWKTFRAVGQNSWRVSFQGIVYLRDQSATKNFALETITEQIRQDGYDIKITFTDTDGYVNYLSGSVLIPLTELSGGAINPFAKWSVEFQGTGELEINASLTPINEEVFTYYYDGIGGETSIIDASLIGVTPLLGFKGTDEYRVITSGTPGQQEILYTSASGQLSWLIELNPPADGVPERITFTYKS